MERWSRGHLLDTEMTRRFMPEQRKRAEAIERQSIFDRFTGMDEGRRRRHIAEVDPRHPDYEENVALIAAAPEMRAMLDTVLEEAYRIESLEFTLLVCNFCDNSGDLHPTMDDRGRAFVPHDLGCTVLKITILVARARGAS